MLRGRWFLAALAVCALLAAGAAGCGDGGANASATPTRRATGTSTPTATTSATATDTPVPTGTPAPLATRPPPPPPTRPPATERRPPAPTQPRAAYPLSIIGRDTRFNTNRLVAPARTLVRLTFANQDAGVRHNIAIVDSTSRALVRTEIKAGPAVDVVDFTTPGPGSYNFFCDVHPRQMSGTLVVQ